MAGLFLTHNVQALLKDKFVVIIGDSIQRAVYKDLVQILQRNEYSDFRDFKTKGEPTYKGDRLIDGGSLYELSNKTSYREVREYRTSEPFSHLVRFYFVTRCYSDYMELILYTLSQGRKPDVIIMNSCLWDITRYGYKSCEKYFSNIKRLCYGLHKTFPQREPLIIWSTCLPVGSAPKGGVFTSDVMLSNHALQIAILQANDIARFYFHKHNFAVFEMHKYLCHSMNHLLEDGVHWTHIAYRHMLNCLLTLISTVWGVKVAANEIFGDQYTYFPVFFDYFGYPTGFLSYPLV